MTVQVCPICASIVTQRDPIHCSGCEETVCKTCVDRDAGVCRHCAALNRRPQTAKSSAPAMEPCPTETIHEEMPHMTQKERLQYKFGGGEPVTTREIAAFLKIEQPGGLLSNMKADGTAEQIARGLWRISPADGQEKPAARRRGGAVAPASAGQSNRRTGLGGPLGETIQSLVDQAGLLEQRAAKIRQAVAALEEIAGDDESEAG